MDHDATYEHIRELLDAYALGALAEDEIAAVESHVAECADCWRELGEAQRVVDVLPLSVPLRQPDPELGRRIMAAAGITPAVSAQPVLSRAHLQRRWLRPLSLAAAVLLSVALGSAAWAGALQMQLNDLKQDNRQLAAASDRVEQQERALVLLSSPDMRRVELTSSGPAAGTMASYAWSRSSGKGVLMCSKMPPPPEGQTYQLWIIRDGRPISAGVFRPDDEGFVVFVVDLTADGPISGYSVTIEPEGGSEQPTADPVLWAQVPVR